MAIAMNQKWANPESFSRQVRRATQKHICAALGDAGYTPAVSDVICRVTPMLKPDYVLIARNGSVVRRTLAWVVERILGF